MTSLQFSGELKGLLQNLVARGLNGEESLRWQEEMCDADELDEMCTGALKDYRSVYTTSSALQWGFFLARD